MDAQSSGLGVRTPVLETSTDSTMQDVLDTWFGAPASNEYGHVRRAWFKKNAAFDAMLLERFGALLDQAQTGALAHWGETPLGALALILLLDQISRNCFRRHPRAFAGDAEALSLARALVANGHDRSLPTIRHREFAYMPFEHDETIESQREAVRLFKGLYDETADAYVEKFLKYAIRHAEVIERFGRFPHRNVILGRESTDDEREWLLTHRGF
jgi:uncharacterized protein (DUF924 family)